MVGSFLQPNRDRAHLVQGKGSNENPDESLRYPQKVGEIVHIPQMLGLIMLKEATDDREYSLMKGWIWVEMVCSSI